MPEHKTRYFGTMTYAEDAVIRFPKGLPGFPDESRFLLIEQPVNAPLLFLQSLNRSDLCFLATPTPAICPEFHLSISAEDLSVIGLPEDRQPAAGKDVLCLALIALSEDKLPAANLLAPVLINWRNHTGVQAIQVDSGYSHTHPIFGEREVARCS